MRTPFIALAALSMIAAPAVANDFVVRHDDLDLSTAKGQKQLDRRIDAEARRYCKMDVQPTGSRVTGSGTSQCYKQARAAAREQMASLIDNAVQKGG
ncbi:MAG: UrcA family protein [Cypionkella sp.]